MHPFYILLAIDLPSSKFLLFNLIIEPIYFLIRLLFAYNVNSFAYAFVSIFLSMTQEMIFFVFVKKFIPSMKHFAILIYLFDCLTASIFVIISINFIIDQVFVLISTVRWFFRVTITYSSYY